MNTWNNNQIPILQLGHEFYDVVQAANFPQGQLRYANSSIGLNIDKNNFVDFAPLENNLKSPLALRYHGHQFQHYNPELGDGRGFLYAQVQSKDNQWYDLGTKGSGTTPYSRQGDGRLTLKGAFREALATEMLESLGVNTSKTLCFFETGENLVRNDEPSPTRSAVLTRYSLGHIRIGTFQRLAFLKQIENIKKLVSYCMNFYYSGQLSEHNITDENLLAAHFLQNVVRRSAKLSAQVMMAGFVHGVLNTDNINISGELFDYGPYRFMPNYDPEFTAAYFDQQGLYCFGRQPASFLWALHQLGASIKLAYPDLPADSILASFSDIFNTEVQVHFLKRLNLKAKHTSKESELVPLFFGMLQENNLNFEQVFFDFNSKRVLEQNQILSKYEKLAPELIKELDQFDVASKSIQMHSYFNAEAPVTLLIDEIENIWSFISQKDDWSIFEKKLQSIRSFRGIY
jgi:serine/tyrosine/threonine adenylyltransferase